MTDEPDTRPFEMIAALCEGIDLGRGFAVPDANAILQCKRLFIAHKYREQGLYPGEALALAVRRLPSPNAPKFRARAHFARVRW